MEDAEEARESFLLQGDAWTREVGIFLRFITQDGIRRIAGPFQRGLIHPVFKIRHLFPGLRVGSVAS